MIKDPSEWTEFISDLTRVYGFENVYSPIVYTLEGRLIGGAKEFQNHVKDAYDRMLKIPVEAKKARAMLLMKENNERMRRMQEGDTMCERIDKSIEDMVNSKYIHQIQDATYELVFDKGIPLYVRNTNLLRDQQVMGKNDNGDKVKLKNNRMITVIDEKLEVEKVLKAEAAINVRLDRTFEDFKKQYQPHIEGQVDPNLRCADRPETAAFDPNKIRPRQKERANPLEEEEKIEFAKLMRIKGKDMMKTVTSTEVKVDGDKDHAPISSERTSQSTKADPNLAP